LHLITGSQVLSGLYSSQEQQQQQAMLIDTSMHINCQLDILRQAAAGSAALNWGHCSSMQARPFNSPEHELTKVMGRRMATSAGSAASQANWSYRPCCQSCTTAIGTAAQGNVSIG